MRRVVLSTLLLSVVLLGNSHTVSLGASAPAQTKSKPAASAKPAVKPAAKPAVKHVAAKPTGILDASYQEIEPLVLLKDPESWIGKKVTFEGTFTSFTPYALDYKKALRTSKDNIAFLIQRPDVTHHVIPLSELKLIYPRKNVEKVMDVESGDKVLVKGTVFSAALGDPWMDVDNLILLKKSAENEAKAKEKEKKKKAGVDE